MGYWLALLLGVIQALTEFLPISSSGHLALVSYWFGFREHQLALVIWLHAGTLLALIWVYRKDLHRLVRDDWPLAGKLLVALLPTAFVGLTLKPLVQEAFGSPSWVGAAFLLTAAALTFGEWQLARRPQPAEVVSWGKALLIGMAQACAVLPGLSRSGATIAAGLLVGLTRPAAARFSFLLSIPTVAVALVVEACETWLLAHAAFPVGPTLVGVAATFAVGLLVLRWLLGFVPQHSLQPFAFYCLGAGAVALAVDTNPG
jgi:undecaprenyl-diphosphatase